MKNDVGFEEVLVEWVHACSQSWHVSRPLARVDIDIITQEVGRRVSQPPNRPGGVSGVGLVGGVAQKSAECGELQDKAF